MLTLVLTKTFKKNLKKYRHKKSVLSELETVVELLLNEKTLPQKYQDHELKGNYRGIRELHLKPDDLLLYIQAKGETITLVAIGSHSDIF